MKSVTHSIFKTFLLSVLMVAQMHFAYAQTASILPPAKTTFLDANGKPLTAGTVESFIPATTTHKTTWQDAAETIPNANPLTLDAAGRALLLGSGSYRQVVKDRLNNVIWDQVTSSTGSGGGGGTASTGDGDVVGTIKPWAGMTAPNQYQFTAGQELSRTTFSALFTAITSTQAIFCNSGSPILNGLGDTTNFWIGMTVELSCVAPGFTTVISKTATTVTLAINANVTTGTNAIFFPWGRGNGSTTFNVPDFRGFAIAGNNNMGGTASANLTTTFFGTQSPNATGAAGGNQSATLLSSNLANPNSTISGITLSNGALTVNGNPFNGGCLNASGNCTGGAQADFNVTTTGSTSVGPTSSTVSVSNQGTISSLTGGIAISATIGSVGSGYTNGSQTITITGGTCTTQPQFTVTIAGNIFTGSPVLLTAGSCTVVPNNPAATTGGGGTGGTLNVVYSAQPFSTLQPTKTSNYIIKVTPDTVSTVTVGVTSLGSMTGDIACGTGLLCTGNNISVAGAALTVGVSAITLGTTTRVLFDNAGFLGEYASVPVTVGGTGGTVASGTLLDNITAFASTGFLTRTGAGTYAFQSTTNGIANSNLAQMGAFTFKGNNSGSTANAGDVDIAALTTKASPAAGDFVILSDQAASGAWKKATVSSVGSAGSVSSIAGNTGAFTLSNGITNSTNDIRLATIAAGSVLGNSTTSSAIPSAVSSPILLNTLTAAASATLSDTTSFTATYSAYDIVFESIIPATAATNLQLNVHSGGTFPVTAYVTQTQANSAGAAAFAQPTTFLQVGSSQNNTGPGISGICHVFAPSGAVVAKQWTCYTAGQTAAPAAMTLMSSGYWNSTGAVDGFQILFSAGNITSGIIKIYGRN